MLDQMPPPPPGFQLEPSPDSSAPQLDPTAGDVPPPPPGFQMESSPAAGTPGVGYFNAGPTGLEPYGVAKTPFTVDDITATYGPPQVSSPGKGIYSKRYAGPVTSKGYGEPLFLRDVPNQKAEEDIGEEEYNTLKAQRAQWDQFQAAKNFAKLPPEQRAQAALGEMLKSPSFKKLPPDQQQSVFLKTVRAYAPELKSLDDETLAHTMGTDFTKGILSSLASQTYEGLEQFKEDLVANVGGSGYSPQTTSNPLRPHSNAVGKALGGAFPALGAILTGQGEALPYIFAAQGTGSAIAEGRQKGYTGEQTATLATERGLYNALIGKVIPGSGAPGKSIVGSMLKTGAEIQGINITQAGLEAQVKKELGIETPEAWEAIIAAAKNEESWAQVPLFAAIHGISMKLQQPKGMDIARGGAVDAASNPFGSEADLPKPADQVRPPDVKVPTAPAEAMQSSEFGGYNEQQPPARAEPTLQEAVNERGQLVDQAAKLAEGHKPPTAPGVKDFSDIPTATAHGEALAKSAGIEFKGVQDNEGLAPNTLTFQIPGEKGGGFNLAEGENFDEALAQKRAALKGAPDGGEVKSAPPLDSQRPGQGGTGGGEAEAVDGGQQGPRVAGEGEQVPPAQGAGAADAAKPQEGEQLDEASTAAKEKEMMWHLAQADAAKIMGPSYKKAFAASGITAEAAHKQIVLDAINEGKPVPARVRESFGLQPDPDRHQSTEEQALRRSISEVETILRATKKGVKRAAIESSVKKSRAKLDEILTAEDAKARAAEPVKVIEPPTPKETPHEETPPTNRNDAGRGAGRKGKAAPAADEPKKTDELGRLTERRDYDATARKWKLVPIEFEPLQVEVGGKHVPAESLNIKDPAHREAIIAAFEAHTARSSDRKAPLTVASIRMADAAYRTHLVPVEAPPRPPHKTDKTPTPEHDLKLWAFPDKVKEVQAIAKQMERAGQYDKPYQVKLAKLKTAPAKRLPQPLKDDPAKLKAALELASPRPGYGDNEGADGYKISNNGKRLEVVSRSTATIVEKRGTDAWGTDGIYGPDGKARPEGKFPATDTLGLRMTGEPMKNIRVELLLRRLRQVESMMEKDQGVIAVLNTDGSLGFAGVNPGTGMAEVGVKEGAKELGGVNPTLLRELLEFHAKMASDGPQTLSRKGLGAIDRLDEVTINWGTGKGDPIFIDSTLGPAEKVRSVLMPFDLEGVDSMEKMRAAMNEDAVTPAEPEGEGAAGTPSNQLEQQKNMAGSANPQVTAAEIVKSMEAMSGTPFRVGHGLFALRKYLGWFDRKRDVIRQQVANQLSTAVHELGHAIHAKIIGWNMPWPKAVAKELVEAGKDLYGGRRPNAGYAREGMAEFVARYMLADNLSKLQATKSWFETSVLTAEPEFAKNWHALKKQFEAWNAQGAAGRVAAHIQRVDTGGMAAIKRGYEFLQNKLWQRLRTAMTTDQAGLEDLVKRVEQDRGAKLPFNQNPAKMRQALKNSFAGTARSFIVDKALSRDFSEAGPGLAEVLRPIKARLDDFSVYATARRAVDLHARGINPGITAADARHTVKLLQSPEFDRALEGITDWSSHVMDYLVDAGGLSPEAAQTIRDLNPVYVPFKRFFEDSAMGGPKGGGGARGVVNQGSGIRRIKGSGRQILEPIEQLAMQAEATIKLANKLDVARSIVELAEKNPGMAYLAEKIPAPIEATSFKLDEVKKQLEDMGVDLSQANLDEVLKVYDNATRYQGKDNIVTLWRNGKREFWELHPDLYKVVTEMDKDQPGVLLHTLAKFKRGVQLGATGLSASFSFIKNPLRDSLTHYIFSQSEDPGRLFYGWFDGLQRELRGDPYAQLWRRAGGEMTTIMGQDRAAAGRLLGEGLAETKTEKAVYTAKHPVDALRQFFGMMESAPRISEFFTTLKSIAAKKGGVINRATVLEALLASKDVTVDFTRAGTVGQSLNMMVPFFNAGIQGSSKFLRTFSGSDGRGPAVSAWGRALPIVLASLGLWWMSKDEEWYKKREKWEKEQYWLASPDGGRHVIRIPKGDIGVAFGTVPVQAMQSVHDQDPAAVNSALLAGMKKFSPLASPLDAIMAMAKPAVEVESNYDSFKGRPIDTERDLGLLPKDRYGKWTTQTAKTLGSWLDTSPKRIEHLMTGYTGGLGLDLARMGEWVAGVRRVKGEAPDLPIAGTLFSREPTGGGAFASEIYDRLGALEQKKGSKAATDAELEEHAKLASAAATLSKMHKARDQMEADGEDTSDLEKEMTALAREVLGK